MPDQPTGTADIVPPPPFTAQCGAPSRGRLNGEGVGGLQVAAETLGQYRHTMDTNPEILMPTVVKRSVCVCVCV